MTYLSVYWIQIGQQTQMIEWHIVNAISSREIFNFSFSAGGAIEQVWRENVHLLEILLCDVFLHYTMDIDEDISLIHL